MYDALKLAHSFALICLPNKPEASELPAEETSSADALIARLQDHKVFNFEKDIAANPQSRAVAKFSIKL